MSSLWRGLALSLVYAPIFDLSVLPRQNWSFLLNTVSNSSSTEGLNVLYVSTLFCSQTSLILQTSMMLPECSQFCSLSCDTEWWKKKLAIYAPKSAFVFVTHCPQKGTSLTRTSIVSSFLYTFCLDCIWGMIAVSVYLLVIAFYLIMEMLDIGSSTQN